MSSLSFRTIIPLLKNNDMTYAALFGSYARGRPHKKSDVDVLVRFSRPKSLFELVRLERTLSERLKKKVDLVTEGFVSPYLKEDIERDLTPIL